MSQQDEYQPPKVWKWEAQDGGNWTKINRPISGATHDKTLPVGEHPFQLYSLATPNGQKTTIMLEELLELGVSDAEYDAWFVNIGDGEQFGSDFVALNPNSKIPVLADHSTQPTTRVFESGAILMYLSEKFGQLLPTDSSRAEALSWLFWQMGATPYLGGGFGHFYAYAPYKMQYPIDRFTMEVKRQLDVLDKQLANNEYIAGKHYSIADIAIYPWYGGLVRGLLYEAGEFLDVESYTHVKRWTELLGERPGLRRGMIVNRAWGPDEKQLVERHAASDFEGKLD